MKFKKIDLAIYLVIMFFVGFLGAYVGLKVMQADTPIVQQNNNGITERPEMKDKQLEKVIQSYDLIKKHFIEEVEDEALLEGAIEGMLDTLEDPYSSYLTVEAMEQFNEQIEASFQGIGAEVSMKEGKVTIVSPIKDSPAEKGGLRPNDIILKVDDEDLEGLNLNEAVDRIRGEKGSEVTIQVQRGQGAKPFDVTLTRDDIPIETVYSEMKEVEGKKTGIIELTSFSERTSEEFIEALEELEAEGMEGLVIDVRGNPGGLLDSVEEILNEFVPKDIPMVQREDREGNRDEAYSDLDDEKDYPISVVVDEGSASASEILAVALKELDYDIVGKTTFGKGTVQQAVPLGDGSTIKLTFFKWLSPEGNWINEVGVEPTIEQDQPAYFYTSPVSLDKPLKINQDNEDVKTAQLMLIGLGFDTKNEVGLFDQDTEDAVKAFQKENDLKVTGEINVETYDKMESQIIDIIRSGDEDLQIQKALDELYK